MGCSSECMCEGGMRDVRALDSVAFTGAFTCVGWGCAFALLGCWPLRMARAACVMCAPCVVHRCVSLSELEWRHALWRPGVQGMHGVNALRAARCNTIQQPVLPRNLSPLTASASARRLVQEPRRQRAVDQADVGPHWCVTMLLLTDASCMCRAQPADVPWWRLRELPLCIHGPFCKCTCQHC